MVHVAPYLTQEWLDERRRLWAEMPERPGATARIQYEVTGEEPVRYWAAYLDGRIEASETGTIGAPEVTLTFSREDGVRMEQGDLDPNVAYRDGLVAFSGDMRTLMGMFPVLWPSPTGRMGTARRYRELQERVRAATEF